jgi:anti-sigma B factor antagonist
VPPLDAHLTLSFEVRNHVVALLMFCEPARIVVNRGAVLGGTAAMNASERRKKPKKTAPDPTRHSVPHHQRTANGYNPPALIDSHSIHAQPIRSTDMTIQERVVGSVTILDLSGKLVLGDGDTLLKDKIHSLVFQARKQIILNMGGVNYMDSSGLGALVASSVTAKNNGGQIKLVSLTKRLQDLLSIAKLLTVFESYDSDEEAINSFAAQATA